MAITFEMEGLGADKYNEALRSFVLGCMAAYTRGVGVGLLMMELAVTKVWHGRDTPAPSRPSGNDKRR